MESKKILIITSSVDDTVSYIMKKYFAMAEFFRVNVDQFSEYKFCIGNEGWSISDQYTTVNSESIYSIYYRKPMLPDLSTYNPQYHLLIQRDIISVINGIVDSFSGKVITKPSILRKAENKVFQMAYASKHGWNIPKSYIGNDEVMGNEFTQTLSIIKPLTTGKTYGKNGWELYQTNIFREIKEDIRLTPIYLQYYIPKQYEVRLTIIDRKVYAVRIDTKNKIDWRMDYQNHKYTMIACPENIIKKCYQMMADFDLIFGAFDFIVTPENEWVFLEVNPNGQWLWLEQSLDLDISKKILDNLIN